jgi:hypothetical protein
MKSTTLAGSRRGSLSAIRPQPRRHYEEEIRMGTPTRPWGSHRLPRTLLSDDPRRVTFRELLRRAEGVPVALADGTEGVVDETTFGPLGFDFWPVELVVATRDGRRRVPAAAIHRIDVREPRLWAGADSSGPLERDHRDPNERQRDEHRPDRLQHRHDLLHEPLLPGRPRPQPRARAGTR